MWGREREGKVRENVRERGEFEREKVKREGGSMWKREREREEEEERKVLLDGEREEEYVRERE